MIGGALQFNEFLRWNLRSRILSNKLNGVCQFSYTLANSRPTSIPLKTVAIDRGPALYFHGRTRILNHFLRCLERAQQI